MPDIPKEILKNKQVDNVIYIYIYDQYDHVLLLAQKLLLKRSENFNLLGQHMPSLSYLYLDVEKKTF